MQPNPGELLRLSSGIYLAVEKISHGLIVKTDAGSSGFLLDRDKILYIEQVICFGNPKSSDLSLASISEI